MAFKNVPKSEKSHLAKKIAETSDICLVYPEEIQVPSWFWYKTGFYFVRVKINAGTKASFYVLELSEDPPEIQPVKLEEWDLFSQLERKRKEL